VPIIVSGYDIKIAMSAEKSVYEAISGTVGVRCYAAITRKDSIPGVIQAKVTIGGGSGAGSYTVTLGPGGSETVNYSFPGAPKQYTITGEVWPVGFDDIFPSDNKDQINVRVNAGTAVPDIDRGTRVGL
jgi:hypothetical protein